jgi:single-strand DNA-binding protein
MAGETYLTLSGNLTAAPKSGVSRSSVPWTRLRVASSARVFDRAAGEWRDGETLFLDVMCWRRLAENAATTLARGDRVLIAGRLRQRSYDDLQGVRRVVTEIEADALGPDLTKSAARLMRPSPAANPEQAGEPAEPAADSPAFAVAAESAVG